MAISTTGSFLQANGAGTSTITVSAVNAGDLCVMAISDSSGTVTPSSLSGTNSMGVFSASPVISDNGLGSSMRLFYATAGAAGSSTLTVTWSGAIGTTHTQFDGWMFTAGLGASTVWQVDGTQIGTRLTSASTTMLYPSLTAASTGELYVGCALASASGAAGSSSGFTYNVDTGFTNVFCFNPSVSGAVAPTATDTAAGTAIAVGALLTASLPVVVSPAVSTVVRQAVTRAAFR